MWGALAIIQVRDDCDFNQGVNEDGEKWLKPELTGFSEQIKCEV